MKTYVFKIVIEQDQFEDGRPAWRASCPALKGCHTWGHSYEEALANAREAVELYVQTSSKQAKKFRQMLCSAALQAGFPPTLWTRSPVEKLSRRSNSTGRHSEPAVDRAF